MGGVVGAAFLRVEKGAFQMQAQRRGAGIAGGGALAQNGLRGRDRRERGGDDGRQEGRHAIARQASGHVPKGVRRGGEIVAECAVQLEIN